MGATTWKSVGICAFLICISSTTLTAASSGNKSPILVESFTSLHCNECRTIEAEVLYPPGRTDIIWLSWVHRNESEELGREAYVARAMSNDVEKSPSIYVDGIATPANDAPSIEKAIQSAHLTKKSDALEMHTEARWLADSGDGAMLSVFVEIVPNYDLSASIDAVAIIIDKSAMFDDAGYDTVPNLGQAYRHSIRFDPAKGKISSLWFNFTEEDLLANHVDLLSGEQGRYALIIGFLDRTGGAPASLEIIDLVEAMQSSKKFTIGPWILMSAPLLGTLLVALADRDREEGMPDINGMATSTPRGIRIEVKVMAGKRGLEVLRVRPPDGWGIHSKIGGISILAEHEITTSFELRPINPNNELMILTAGLEADVEGLGTWILDVEVQNPNYHKSKTQEI